MTWYEHVKGSSSRKASTDLSSMLLCLVDFVYCGYTHKTDDFVIWLRNMLYQAMFVARLFFFRKTAPIAIKLSTAYLSNHGNAIGIATRFSGIFLADIAPDVVLFGRLSSLGQPPSPSLIHRTTSYITKPSSIICVSLPLFRQAHEDFGRRIEVDRSMVTSWPCS